MEKIVALSDTDFQKALECDRFGWIYINENPEQEFIVGEKVDLTNNDSLIIAKIEAISNHTSFQEVVFIPRTILL